MRFSIALLAFIFITLVLSSPLPDKKDSKDKDSDKNEKSSSDSDSDKKETKSKATASEEGAATLSSRPYSELQISSGVAGNAEQEAAAKFNGLDKVDPATVSKADRDMIKQIHDIAEKAEINAFNPAIEKATGDELKALKIGKTKNKVLKTSATALVQKIDKAHGKDVDPAKMAKELAKKAKNIKLDVEAKGQASKEVTLDG
ncbi:putative small secreted protein [Erysiphe neolycopersici]|uniref:Putative small secreted protein n=1 Tax=Erysiphe neolycopersici TaxID=212602 RepID=A0A420I7Y3_9PEZI|nr:putative small secreted protein [Erysiphe neolycopersici]